MMIPTFTFSPISGSLIAAGRLGRDRDVRFEVRDPPLEDLHKIPRGAFSAATLASSGPFRRDALAASAAKAPATPTAAGKPSLAHADRSSRRR
jgi:hypothetical protein